MKTFNQIDITIGYNIKDWVIGIQFIKFEDGVKHIQILCFYLEW